MRKIWDDRFAGKLEGWGILRNGGILVIGGMILKWEGGEVITLYGLCT